MTENNIKDITITHPSGSTTAVISTFGAHLTSWNVNGKENIFMSKKAIMDGSRAIRGGIPICFPQFGPGKMQQHGFARNVIWEFVNTKSIIGSGDVQAIFRLIASEKTRLIWPHEFEVLYIVTLGVSTLKTELIVKNTDSTAFEFQSLLHTYFQTDSTNTKLRGLQGLDYLDTADNHVLKTEIGDNITFSGEIVDRVYKRNVVNKTTNRSRVEDAMIIEDGGNTELVIYADNYDEAVVWNPGAKKCAVMDDMHKDAWREFICCEVGTAIKFHTIQPGQSKSFSQTITLSPIFKAKL